MFTFNTDSRNTVSSRSQTVAEGLATTEIKNGRKRKLRKFRGLYGGFHLFFVLAVMAHICKRAQLKLEKINRS